MSDTVVYWLFDDHCVCPRLHGYVGISARFINRLKEHRCSGQFPPFKYAILLSGSDEECFELERGLRPQHRIGWNKTKGGQNQGRTLGYTYSDEARANVSAALKGRKITWRDKLAKASMGKPQSDTKRRKLSEAHRGVPKSIAHRAAISAATKLRYARAGEREKTAVAVRAGLARAHPRLEKET